MILGIDAGASFTDVVIFNGEKVKNKKIMYKFSIESEKLKQKNKINIKKFETFLKKNLSKNKIYVSKISEIKITGSSFKPKTILGIKAQHRNEITSIAEGAKFISGKNNFIVANIGTGTPFIRIHGKKAVHLGGTGLGGGTIEGISKLVLKCHVSETEKLAMKGKNSLDLTVGDIVKGHVGIIPKDATASNFGKIKGTKFSKNDFAFSLINSVAESIGVMTYLAAKSENTKTIIFTGRVANNKLVRKRISVALKIFNLKPIFPKNAEYCTAIGAALK
ncbi:MAG: hypothetical protein V1672_04255 [Candidatus Diapherotrites archaeon]